MSDAENDDTGMYMGGRGLMKRTRELNDAMWDAVLPAWAGTSLAIVVPVISFFVTAAGTASRLPWEKPLSSWIWFIPIGLSAVAIPLGIRLSLPWFRARTAVRAHREAMEREGAKRGPGWAQS